MISDTLASRLQEYGIGPKIRALRLAKRMSLIELGKHSGLSSGLLSKFERGILIPPLPTCSGSPWCSVSAGALLYCWRPTRSGGRAQAGPLADAE